MVRAALLGCFADFNFAFLCVLLTVYQASFANPTQIYGDDVIEEKGENARLSAFVGAIAVGDLVKTTLGPKGMDKILQSAYVEESAGWGMRAAHTDAFFLLFSTL